MSAKLGSLSLTSHAQLIEVYDGHLMRHEGSLGCEIIWNGRTYTHRIAVIQSEKHLSLIGRKVAQ